MSKYAWQNIQRRIKDIEYPVGAEIGVHRGDFSRSLLDSIRGLTLYMIDAWSFNTYDHVYDTEESATKTKLNYYIYKWIENYKSACDCMRAYPGHAFVLRGMSLDIVKMFSDGFFDFVYIDAAHDYESVKKDIIAWTLKVKKGGYICGHDYGVFPGVKKAVDEIFPDAEIDSDFTWFKQI